MNAPRCNKHRDAPTAPRLCHTCQRIAVEQDLVTRTVDALLAAGYALQTDIQEDPRPAMPTTDRAAILAEMMDVDDEFLGAWRIDSDTPICVTTTNDAHRYTESARAVADAENAGAGRDLLPEMIEALCSEGEFWFTPAVVARLADKRPDAWVRFVYGNDGHDVVSDYTTNLESVLAPINAYADTLA